MKRYVFSLLLLTVPAMGMSQTYNMKTRAAYDFVCDYGRYWKIIWDDWEGALELYPGGTGVLTSAGKSFDVRHIVATNPQDNIEGSRGPGFIDGDSSSSLNHRLVFWVDFNYTPSDLNDDQRFDGYMTTASPGYEYIYPQPEFQQFSASLRHQIQGITWWRGIPFSFYTSASISDGAGSCL